MFSNLSVGVGLTFDESTVGAVTNKIGGALGGVAKVGAGVVAGLGVGLAGAVTAYGASVVNLGNDFNKALKSVQMQTGATGEEVKALGDSMKNVYAGNFGEDMQDVADVMSKVKQTTGLLGVELEKATEATFLLRDNFEIDPEGSTLAANNMMKQFGISAEEAYNIIATGAQNGANQNGDLVDVLNEYSVHYAQLGLDVNEFSKSLETASEMGVWQMDKVGDAVKEFGIRTKDGSKASAEAFESLGFNAEEMTAKFNAGGETASQAFYEVINAIDGVTDATQKEAIGVALMGTMYEDIGSDILPILASMEGATESTVDTLAQMNEIKYEDLGSAVEGIKRTLEVGLLPVASELANGLTGVANSFREAISDGVITEEEMEEIKGQVVSFVDGITSLITDNSGGIVSMVAGLLEGIITALVEAVPTLVPMLLEALFNLINTVVELLTSNMDNIAQLAVDLVTTLVNGISTALPKIIEAAVLILVTLMETLMSLYPELIPVAINLMMTLINTILENLPLVIEVALQLIIALVQGLASALPQLVSYLPTIIASIVKTLISLLPMILEAGGTLILELLKGIMLLLPEVLLFPFTLYSELVKAFTGLDMKSIGKNLLEGIWQGIKNATGWLKDNFVGAISSVTDGVKSWLGIKSPSRRYMGIGGYMGEGVGVGFAQEADFIEESIQESIPTEYDVGMKLNVKSADYSLDDIPVTTIGSGVSDVDSQIIASTSRLGVESNKQGDVHIHVDKFIGDKRFKDELARDVKEIITKDDYKKGK